MTRREREALVEGLLNRAWVIDSKYPRRLRVPGQVVASLPAATRRKLEELTAADFQHRQT